MTPWLHVGLAVGLYLLVAIANLVVLAAVVLLLVWLDRRPVSDLGLGLAGRDLRFAALGAFGTVALGGAFVGWLRRRDRVELGARTPSPPAGGGASLPVTLLVLLIVVVQEEVLYRGYVMLALLPYGAGPRSSRSRGRRTAEIGRCSG